MGLNEEQLRAYVQSLQEEMNLIAAKYAAKQMLITALRHDLRKLCTHPSVYRKGVPMYCSSCGASL